MLQAILRQKLTWHGICWVSALSGWLGSDTGHLWMSAVTEDPLGKALPRNPLATGPSDCSAKLETSLPQQLLVPLCFLLQLLVKGEADPRLGSTCFLFCKSVLQHPVYPFEDR